MFSAFTNWGKINIHPEKLTATRLLLEAMFKFGGIPVDAAADSLTDSFYELGGTSLNTLSVLSYLHKNGCKLSLDAFLDAKNLMEVIARMSDIIGRKTDPKETKVSDWANPALCTVLASDKYIVGPLPGDKKNIAIELMAGAYAENGEWERYHSVDYDQYYDHFLGVWEDLIDDEMSTVVQDGRRVLGCSFNQDFYTPSPEISKSKTLFDVLEYLTELKGSVLNLLPHWKESIFEVVWMGTDASLAPNENVRVITMLMNENLRQAMKSGFTSVFILAANKFVRELCVDGFGFEILDEYPTRAFQETEGWKPFRAAPATMATAICWKVIGNLPSETSSMNPSTRTSRGGAVKERSKYDYRESGDVLKLNDEKKRAKQIE